MSDTNKWANSTQKDLINIGEKWARKYSEKKLRAFQTFYNDCLKTKCKTDLEIKAMQNRLEAVYYALLEKC